MTALARRQLLGAGLATGLAWVLPASARGQNRIPQKTSARVIVDNDFAGDPDGLAALAHQLLSPKTETRLVTVSLLDPGFSIPGIPAGTSVARGVALARELVERIGIASAPKVAGGNELASDPAPSDAAKAIVAEAMRDDKLPLFLTCGGPLTNVAAALRLEPTIAKRMTLVWIGGGGYPDGGWEYNLSADPAAARAVIEQSAVPVWQVPQPAYRQMQVSVAELAADMRPTSDFARWLYDRFTSPPDFIDVSGAWPLGDSPLTLLTAVSAESSQYRDVPGRRIRDDLSYGDAIPGRTVRVFERLDVRLAVADFLAKLRLHASGM